MIVSPCHLAHVDPVSHRMPVALRRPDRLRLVAVRRGGTVLAAAVAAWLSACAAVGPDYMRPPVEAPLAYKESGPWKVAEPRGVDTSQAWWEAFGDATLNALIGDARAANPTLREAEAQYRQARAVAAQARAGFWPGVGVSGGAARARSSTSAGTNDGRSVRLASDVDLSLSASWEPDLWGSVRRSVESGEASAAASADDVAAARLSIETQLAQDYLQLRVTDLQRDLYAATTAAFTRSLQLTQAQYRAGVVLRSDVALAESQLKTAEAQGVDLEATRSQLEHSIAILTGRAPAAFDLPPVATTAAALRASLPAIPTGLPSELLERRPDIAAAERRVAAANAQIGVAQAAFYPALTLSAGGGFSGVALGTLFDTPGRVWSLGATLGQTLFDGGLRRARSDEAVAAYDASVAQYKSTVLTGFQQVEDNLAVLRVLDRESVLVDDAVAAAQLAERSALAQYRGGTATYLSVVTAQSLALDNQRSATQVLGRRLAASVALITATGGGWNAAAAAAAPPAAVVAPGAGARLSSIDRPAPLALAAPPGSAVP